MAEKRRIEFNPGIVIQLGKMAVTPQLSRDWLKIGHRYSLGIKGFRNLEIERILSGSSLGGVLKPKNWFRTFYRQQ